MTAGWESEKSGMIYLYSSRSGVEAVLSSKIYTKFAKIIQGDRYTKWIPHDVYVPGEPKLRDCFITEIFRKLSTANAKLNIHEIAQFMEIYIVLV